MPSFMENGQILPLQIKICIVIRLASLNMPEYLGLNEQNGRDYTQAGRMSSSLLCIRLISRRLKGLELN